MNHSAGKPISLSITVSAVIKESTAGYQLLGIVDTDVKRTPVPSDFILFGPGMPRGGIPRLELSIRNGRKLLFPLSICVEPEQVHAHVASIPGMGSPEGAT